jgi:hypothetical protein
MAEVLTQNTDSNLQLGEESPANSRASLVRSLSFKYYIHDSVPTLRFQLVGDLRAANIAELNGAWETSRPTLNLRRFVLDVTQLYSADGEARKWLLKMNDSGAAFLPPNYLTPAAHATTAHSREQAAAVKLSLIGRVLGMIRRER